MPGAIILKSFSGLKRIETIAWKNLAMLLVCEPHFIADSEAESVGDDAHGLACQRELPDQAATTEP